LSEQWEKVTVLGRTRWIAPPHLADKINVAEYEKQGKLVQHVIDMEQLAERKEDILQHFQNHDAAFCTLGTTHGDAGSMAAFRRVDFDYVDATAYAANLSKIPYFAHVTAQGTGSFINYLTNYGRTKAAIEQKLQEYQFPFTSIYRPGLLDRNTLLRPGESFVVNYLPIVPSISVGIVGTAMRLDAEATLRQIGGGTHQTSTTPNPVFTVIENNDIYNHAKAP
jgi:hypothetical protein